jgi:hypothetical protein
MLLASNPFVGPRAYKEEEAKLFFGRDVDLERLLDQLIPDRLVLVYSVSGAGKTSLFQALLMPALKREEFEVFPRIRVGLGVIRDSTLTGPNRYVVSTIQSLEKNLDRPLCGDGEIGHITLSEYLARRELASGRDPNFPRALIFDQFEEVVAVDPTDLEAKTTFFEQLGEALRPRHRWAVVGMREEWVAALDPYVSLIPTRLHSRFRLEPLTVDSATDAIRKPIEDRGVAISPEAVEHLVDNLRLVKVQGPDGPIERKGPYVEAVQLQVVCRRIWDDLSQLKRKIELSDVDKISIDSALGDYYADEIAKAVATGKVTERTLRIWFERELIINRSIRGQIMETPAQTKGLDNKLIELFVDAFLVRREDRRGARWYELAHDRLVRPISDSNARWLLANRTIFQQQLERWIASHRAPDYLLSGRALDEARDWVAEHDNEVDETGHEFLLLSERAQVQAVRKRRSVLSAAVVLLLILSGWLGKTQRTLSVQQGQDSLRRQAFDSLKGAAAVTSANSRVVSRIYCDEVLATGKFNTADCALALSAAKEIANRSDTSRAPIARDSRIDYRAREADQHKVNDALRDLGFTVDVQSSPMVEPSNAVTYGSGVPLEDVRVVCLALMRAGVKIQRVSHFKQERREQTHVIQIHSVPNLESAPWTIGEVLALGAKL